jgi:hypothetical protein
MIGRGVAAVTRRWDEGVAELLAERGFKVGVTRRGRLRFWRRGGELFANSTLAEAAAALGVAPRDLEESLAAEKGPRGDYADGPGGATGTDPLSILAAYNRLALEDLDKKILGESPDVAPAGVPDARTLELMDRMCREYHRVAAQGPVEGFDPETQRVRVTGFIPGPTPADWLFGYVVEAGQDVSCRGLSGPFPAGAEDYYVRELAGAPKAAVAAARAAVKRALALGYRPDQMGPRLLQGLADG